MYGVLISWRVSFIEQNSIPGVGIFLKFSNPTFLNTKLQFPQNQNSKKYYVFS